MCEVGEGGGVCEVAEAGGQRRCVSVAGHLW